MNGTALSSASLAPSPAEPPRRIASIDALRGLVMFTMIFVNDIHGASHEIVPWWMRHFQEDGNGMTFVDLVFPAFLFIVGMSIPFAIGSRRTRHEPSWKILLHVAGRTAALLFLGILMVNDESQAPAADDWSPALWAVLMYASAIFAFCDLAARRKSSETQRRFNALGISTWVLRAIGLASLVYLTFSFRGEHEQRILRLSPFSIHTEWYGILGLVGWAYLAAAAAFWIFRTNRTALLGCVAVLMCLYPAERTHLFEHFHVRPAIWLSNIVNLGETLGSQAAIAVAGVLLGTILLTPESSTDRTRLKFTILFILGFSSAAFLLHGLYGINKNAATPSWCLWACAITAALWLVLYFVCDVWRIGAIAKPLRLAGQNVLLAYLLSNLLGPLLELLQLSDWYDSLAGPHLANAVARSAGTALIILSFTVLLNRFGFRLKI
jgi:heparan-alpha-glucosaminide N-acetyltransferase